MKPSYWLITLAVIVADLWTKWLVYSRMNLYDAIEVLPGYFRISYVRNSGVAFGLFNDIQSVWKPYLLGAMALVAVVVIVVYSFRMPPGRVLLQMALAVTLGGIVGNFADRILDGYVVDFLEFHVRDSFHWPTFNIADSAITVGICLLMLDAIRHPESKENTS